MLDCFELISSLLKCIIRSQVVLKLLTQKQGDQYVRRIAYRAHVESLFIAKHIRTGRQLFAKEVFPNNQHVHTCQTQASPRLEQDYPMFRNVDVLV